MAGKGSASNDEFGVLVLTDMVDESSSLVSPVPGEAGFKPESLFDRLRFRRPRLAGARAVGLNPEQEQLIAPTWPGLEAAPSARKQGSRVPYIDENKILRIGRRRLGLALLWILQSEGVTVREAAKSNPVGGETPDLYIRRRKTQQIGFAFTHTGLAHGHTAAATAFRISNQDDWIAVFALLEYTPDNGPIQAWWLIGYREGLVYEDKLIYELTAAQAALEEHIATSGWGRVIAPAEWQFPYTESVTLGDVISPRSAGMLRSLNPLRANAVPAVMGVLFIGVATGGYLYWQNLLEQEQLLREMELRRLENERLANLQTPPWVGTPTVADFLRTCSAAVERSLLLTPGWNAGEIVCTHSEGTVTISASWSRAGGRAAWILAAAQVRGLGIVLAPSLDNASFSEVLTLPEREEVNLDPFPADKLDRTLRLRFDTLLLDASLRQIESRPAPEAAQEQGAPIWNYHALTFRTSAVMDEYLALIADVPAVVPERLSYNALSHEWTLDIQIYHPPIGAMQ